MDDIRLKSVPFEFEGQTYNLVCNMNVIADLQEMNGGKLRNALKGERSLNATKQTLSAMLNDAFDSAGINRQVTPRELGRILDFNTITDIGVKIFPLVTDAIIDYMEDNGEKH